MCEENAGARINLERLQMAERTGAPMLVSNCPFCLTMFEDGIKCGGYEGRLVAKDLAEVIAERVTSNCSEILPGGTHEAAGLHQTGSRPGIQI